jgi:hypothetical protein
MNTTAGQHNTSAVTAELAAGHLEHYQNKDHLPTTFKQ